MALPNETSAAPAGGRDLLLAEGYLSIAGPGSTAVAASAKPVRGVAAPSNCAVASTTQTGTEIRGLTIRANGIRQYLEAGSGPPVVLLHGFPETNYAWRYQIPVLARRYRVIAPDLRGYGETDKPASGYDKRNMANDLRALMKAIDLRKIALVGHDRGARVATRFAKDHPDAIDRLVVMDNVPTRIIARDFDVQKARAYWFLLFHLVPDLPEALIAGRENVWLRHFFSDWCYNPAAISGEAFVTPPGVGGGVVARHLIESSLDQLEPKTTALASLQGSSPMRTRSLIMTPLIGSVMIGMAGLLPMLTVTGYGQTNNGSKADVAVDANGNLHVPVDYRTTYQFLGSWAVAADQGKGSKELHDVYASPGTIAAYRRDGRFPDGAVLVKEVFETATGEMTTGTVSHAQSLKGWFVMMRDDNNRHPGNKLWGDGWGWSWFDSDKPSKTTSTDYNTDCKPCHVPARASDWIYVSGYAPLRR